MQVLFKPSFIKDAKKLPSFVYVEVKRICLTIFPSIESPRDLSGLDIQKLRGFRSYYKIRIGDYRVGFKVEDRVVTFMRVLHRKDIYRYFP